MGGAEKLAKRHAEGRLDARQRLETLLDPGSFRELGTLVGAMDRVLPGVPADALVAGTGRIEGRPVVAAAEDFTCKGGSIGLGAHAKRIRIAKLAAQERVPLVMLLEGAGERVTNSLERYPYAPNDLQALVELSGIVPSVAVVMGPSAGHGALTAPLMDFVVMVEGAAIFSAGPPLVVEATGEEVSMEELGGARIHTGHSGVAHNATPDDAAALALVRRYLAYFPSSAWQRTPRKVDGDLGERSLDALLDLIPPNPRKPYDMRKVVALLADEGSVLEVQPRFGSSMVTALAFLGGRSVAIVANQPMVKAGAIDRDAADKAARFLEIADAFHLPAIFLADNPGVMAGTAAEREGVLRHAARMFAAQSRMRVPKVHVTLRKAYGFGSSLMAMNPFDRQTLSLAFPGATLGAMPAKGGGAAAGADSATQEQLDVGESAGPWATADTMSYDEVIDPRELRNVLLDALELASGRDAESPGPAVRPGLLP
ncbi:MAG: acetyl-CoA carboxylase carboxyltransferase subunit [Deltaproteobacteria bacterium]|nr:acetyl-CoA carboxylase carboxyltransferase subunit [Deltaproteobacteria bacterium]MBW2418814.1 acetyl-CoA carboxylase carboxyltransferase subunit [Deltaproteobacteria bacterium]